MRMLQQLLTRALPLLLLLLAAAGRGAVADEAGDAVEAASAEDECAFVPSAVPDEAARARESAERFSECGADISEPRVAQSCPDCEWQAWAHALQRRLALRLPVASAGLHGTHNTFNSFASTGLLIEAPHNNLYTVSQQMDVLGVRQVELDPHFMEARREELGNNETNMMRNCHIGKTAGGQIRDLCSGTSWLPCQSLNIFDYGDETGCGRDAPPLENALREVAAWAERSRDAGDDDFTLVYLDDFVRGRFDVLDDIVEQVGLAEHVFTPADWSAFSGVPLDLAAARGRSGELIEQNPDYPAKDITRWPSMRHMVRDLGRRVIMFTPVNRTEAEFGPSEYCFPNEMRRKFNVLTEFFPNNCSDVENTYLPFNYVQGDATKYVIFGVVLDNSKRGANFVTENRGRWSARCGFGTYYDLMDVQLASSAVWSWEAHRPADATEETRRERSCVHTSGTPVRFVDTTECETRRRVACQREQRGGDDAGAVTGVFSAEDALDWVVTDSKFSWDDAAGACPAGYRFAVPHSALEMRALAAKAAGPLAIVRDLLDISPVECVQLENGTLVPFEQFEETVEDGDTVGERIVARRETLACSLLAFDEAWVNYHAEPQDEAGSRCWADDSGDEPLCNKHEADVAEACCKICRVDLKSAAGRAASPAAGVAALVAAAALAVAAARSL